MKKHMTTLEIHDLIELAIAVARHNTRNDQQTIDDVEKELWDALGLWDKEWQ